MRKSFLVFAIACLILLFGCVSSQEVVQQSQDVVNNVSVDDTVIAKLVGVELAVNESGGNFVPSAGLYEGRLNLQDIKDSSVNYSIFVCNGDWSYVQRSCYRFSPSKVEKGIEALKFSMELSGCYSGVLETVNC